MVRETLFIGTLAMFLVAAAGKAQGIPGPGTSAFPSEAEIRQILADRIQALSGQEGSFGIVVGVVGPDGRKIVAHGHPRRGDARPLGGDSVFEIGSVTKAFTAILLADMARKGEVALADPVAKHLPAGVKLPERNGRSITLVDLATHTSGLPFMPDTLLASNGSAAEFYQYLAGYQPRRDIGESWDYSNLGYWLLGQALAFRAGLDYESLLRSRVIEPLKLAGTGLTLSPTMKATFATGHDAASEPSPLISKVPPYSLMPAAGGLFSTVDDLLTLLSVALGNEPSPLSAAIETTLTTRRPTLQAGNEQALGWTVLGQDSELLFFRDGGTFGYASGVVWDPARKIGVVVLSNQVSSVSDIARHLLRPGFPLEKPAVTRRVEITLEPTLLDRYAGRYEAPGEGIFTILREADFLKLETPPSWGLPALRIRAESPRELFAAELPLRVTIEINDAGAVTGILIHPPRGQEAIPARRLDADR